MPPRRRLAAVAQTPRKAAPKSVTKAASDGTRRELLVATRDRVAIAVEDPNTPARDLASLTRRLLEIARDIEAIDAREQHETRSSGAAAADDTFDASAI